MKISKEILKRNNTNCVCGLKFNGKYTNGIVYPQVINNQLVNLCDRCNIAYLDNPQEYINRIDTDPNDESIINPIPDNATKEIILHLIENYNLSHI